MFELPEYKVYIKIDNNNQIININSSAYLKDASGWIEIDKGQGFKYQHAQNYYLKKPIKKNRKNYNYKWENNQIVECSDEEIQQNNSIKQITQLDRIEAQITYTAMMTDTLLEG